jgi:hypothetical protein
MSVDRNYTFRISTTADSAAPQSGQRKRVNASLQWTEDKMRNVSNRDPGEIIEGADSPKPGALLSREIDGALSDTSNSGTTTSAPLSTPSKDGIDGTLPEEFATEVMRYSDDIQAVNPEFSRDHTDSRASDEPSQSHSKANANDRAELVNQVRQLQTSFHAQAPVITRQDLAEMLSVVHQLKDMFLERESKNVTRQELKSELQALRLVMEGRK